MNADQAMHALPFRPDDAALVRDRAFVAGEWIGAADGARFQGVDPATGRLIAEVANCGAEDTRRGIERRIGIVAMS